MLAVPPRRGDKTDQRLIIRLSVLGGRAFHLGQTRPSRPTERFAA